MWKRLLHYKWYLLAYLGLIVTVPSISSYLTLLLQRLYNESSAGISTRRIFQLVLTGVLIWLLNRLLFYSQDLLRSRLICNIKQDLKRDIFAAAFSLEAGQLSALGDSGAYISLFTNDVSILEQRYLTVLLDLIAQLFSFVIVGLAFFGMERRLALFVLIFGVLVMFVPTVFSRRLNRANLQYSDRLSELTQGLKESFSSGSAIKNFAVEDVFQERFDTRNRSAEDAKFRFDSSLALADGAGSLLTWFARMMVIGAGLILVSRGELLLGTVMAAQSFAVELAMPLQDIVRDVNSIRSVRSILQKIVALTTGRGEPVGAAVPEGDEPLTVTVEDLTLRAGDRAIVDGFSFSFQPGKRYLVLGRNGAGKSSVFKAMKRQLRPSGGRIALNGRDLESFSARELNERIAYLSEKVSLFSGTVCENITLGRPVSPEALAEAVRLSRLPLALDRPLGEDGRDISSGEQRRIELARSFLSPAKLLVFDEVLSSLDVETAYEIEKTALSLPGKTLVFISHNFSAALIESYDEILLMGDGRLLAHGPYRELLESSPAFRRICQIKFGKV